jgi:hypothetical protein
VERLHLKPLPDTHTGRDCQSCRHSDPDFENRNLLDRLVCSKQNGTAAAHMTENGYVRHLITLSPAASKSATQKF